MQSNLENNTHGNSYEGNVYTMNYSELVSKTMLHYEIAEIAFPHDAIRADWDNITVTVDTLKYHPFMEDEIVRELSIGITSNSEITHDSGIYSGNELFPECGDSEYVQLFESRGEGLTEHHNPVVLEEGHHEEFNHNKDYYLRPEVVTVPAGVFPEQNLLEKEFDILPADEKLSRKAENLKSPLEKLLDQLCLA